ncbi:unknown [Streptococcus phage M102AD]|uniref:hypothetical protein n=1 Tax=Streptococcus phage M102AD TaxID=1587907 RepID=UPI00022FA23F|nr:hypothetical protein AVU37_gp32 [Streptococcus phage M102AD]ABD48935.1 unknown [Streptococcus phage M102AD]
MDNYKDIEEMNLKVSKKVAQTYPVVSKEKYVLLFENVFGAFCANILQKNKIEAQDNLAGLLNIMNALYIRITLRNYNYDSEQLERYLMTVKDEYAVSQEILDNFTDFRLHLQEPFVSGFYKAINFVLTTIFAYAIKFSDGYLALCYAANELAERGVEIL